MSKSGVLSLTKEAKSTVTGCFQARVKAHQPTGTQISYRTQAFCIPPPKTVVDTLLLTGFFKTRIKLINLCILRFQSRGPGTNKFPLPASREDSMTQSKVRYMIHNCTNGVTMPYYFVVKRSKVSICGAEYSSLNPALSLNQA